MAIQEVEIVRQTVLKLLENVGPTTKFLREDIEHSELIDQDSFLQALENIQEFVDVDPFELKSTIDSLRKLRRQLMAAYMMVETPKEKTRYHRLCKITQLALSFYDIGKPTRSPRDRN